MSNFSQLAVEEKSQLFTDLVSGQRPIQISIMKEQLRSGTVHEKIQDFIYFKLPFIQRFEGTREAIITFSLPPDVYFMKTEVTGDGANFFFKETSEIFKLQRRDTFRLEVPSIVQAEVLFKGIAYRVFDLSQGGFSIELPAAQSHRFVTGSRLIGDLEIAGEKFPKVKVEAKHARIQTESKSKVLVGFQFLKLDAKHEQSLFRIITDIARNHFR